MSNVKINEELSNVNKTLCNPNCIFGEVENNYHCLLTSPCYTHMRNEVVTSINQVTNLALATDALLFGTEEVSDKLNV